jgi:hypothetical protein
MMTMMKKMMMQALLAPPLQPWRRGAAAPGPSAAPVAVDGAGGAGARLLALVPYSALEGRDGGGAAPCWLGRPAAAGSWFWFTL